LGLHIFATATISDFSGHIFRETSVEWHCAKQWGSEIESGTKVQSLICINRAYICKSGAIFLLYGEDRLTGSL